MQGMHLALWILVAFSLAGAAVSALRGKHAGAPETVGPQATAVRPGPVLSTDRV